VCVFYFSPSAWVVVGIQIKIPLKQGLMLMQSLYSVQIDPETHKSILLD